MVQASKVFADTPVLNIIPDIPYYYKSVPGFSFIIDLILLSLACAQMLTFAGEKAKMPKKLGAIIGIIFGASLTFAIHAANYTLLQHWATWLFIALEFGFVMYLRYKPRFGTGGALVVGFLSAMVPLALGRGATAGEYAQGWTNLALFALAIIALFSVWGNVRRGGAEGGDRGRPPTPTPGPDTETTRRIVALEAAAGQHEQRLGLVDRAIQDIRGLIDDILRRLADLEEFRRSWERFFQQLQPRIDDLQAQITRNHQLTDSQIASIRTWQTEIDTFRNNNDRALAELAAQMESGRQRLETVRAELAALRADHQALNSRVEDVRRQVDSLTQRVGQLPAEIAATIQQQQIDPINAKITELQGKLASMQGIEKRLKDLEDLVQKLDIPTLTTQLQQLKQAQEQMTKAIEDLQKKINAITRNPKDGKALGKGVIDLKNSNRNVINQFSIIDSTLKDVHLFAPQLAQLLDGFKQLTEAQRHSQEAGTLIATLADLMKKCHANVGQAEEKEQKKKGAKKTEAALEEVTLNTIQQNVNTQYALMVDIRKKVEAIMHNLDLNLMRKQGTETQYLAAWEAQLKAALNEAVVDAKKDLKQKFTVEELKLKECIEQLHQARLVAERIVAANADEQKRKAEFVQHITNLEAREAHLLKFVDQFEQTITAQVIQFASASSKTNIPGPEILRNLRTALAPYLDNLDKALRELEVIQTAVKVAKTKAYGTFPPKKI